MHKPLLVANWKMNLGISASALLAKEIASHYKNNSSYDLWLAPSYTAIEATIKASASSGIKIGAQNVHWEKSGAFTGEISVAILQELGASFSLIGHSERRHIFYESDEMLAKRAECALNNNLTIIYCIGETLQERTENKTIQVLEQQLSPLINLIKKFTSKNIVIAYEPVWAIGTGKVATIEDIQIAHGFISKKVSDCTGEIVPRLLYGGSVTAENFQDIINLDVVDGALVGGASLSVEKFLPLMRICSV
jgi:triosephosphate isomerase (TIM)